MISVIVPTLNEEKTIEKTLVSIKSHAFPGDEIIITDAGSTDATTGIAKKYTDKIFSYPKDRPQNIARNRNWGAAHALGDYLVFIDSDCILKNQDFFKIALQNFKDHPDIIALTCYVGSDPAIATLSDKIIFGFINNLYRFTNNIVGKGMAVGKFQMMTRNAFDKVKGYREDLVTTEDNDMFGRLSKIGKTRMAYDLKVYHSNRRARAIGWPKLLWIWTVNSFYYTFRDKSHAKDWMGSR